MTPSGWNTDEDYLSRQLFESQEELEAMRSLLEEREAEELRVR
jgi:hypothetical protein